jgi:hypothetical protein
MMAHKKLFIVAGVAAVAGYLLSGLIIPGFNSGWMYLPGFKQLYLAINKNP